MLKGNILITGGTGYLGRGILRRAQRDGWPAKFTILSRDEEKQYRCAQQFPDARFVLGDITDLGRVQNLMVGHDAVIHAAAAKFIPEGEFNVDEFARVNVVGSGTVLHAARTVHMASLVAISTDKAAQPVNTYGITKALMERLVSEYGYNACRYGNVIGSTGSVVPVMREQFREDGCIRVTDPDMTRFWMSINDAVDTIVKAFAAPRGSITVPVPRAARMIDIAHAVLEVCGSEFEAGRIQVVGKRPGEKQHEDLITHYELYRTKAYDNFYAIMPPGSEDYTRELPTMSSNLAEPLSRTELVQMIRESEGV
jgi:UDP-N-acetylglucosamine 4,6-dehydratase